jgi:hypothetical protein
MLSQFVAWKFGYSHYFFMNFCLAFDENCYRDMQDLGAAGNSKTSEVNFDKSWCAIDSNAESLYLSWRRPACIKRKDNDSVWH